MGYDGPDSWFVPESLDDFERIGEAALDYLWRCQDASGNLAATLGGTVLTANGSGHVYQQSVPGWARRSVGCPTDALTCAFRMVSGTGPNPEAGSVAWPLLAYFPSEPPSDRVIFVLANSGAGDNFRVEINPDGTLSIVINSVRTPGEGSYLDGGAHWIIPVFDTRGDGVAAVYTEQETIFGAFPAALTDGTKGLGSTSGGATGVYRYLWAGAAVGANAERDWRQFIERVTRTPRVGRPFHEALSRRRAELPDVTSDLRPAPFGWWPGGGR